MTPGQKITEEAFDAFARWETKYSEALEDIELPDRAEVYSFWCDGLDIGAAIAVVACKRSDTEQ